MQEEMWLEVNPKGILMYMFKDTMGDVSAYVIHGFKPDGSYALEFIYRKLGGQGG